MQLVAFVVVQDKVADEPLEIVVEPAEPLARRSTVGGTAPPDMLTFTDLLVLPPGPVQVIVMVLLEVTGPQLLRVPLVPTLPLQFVVATDALAVQLVAFVLLQTERTRLPDGTVTVPVEPLTVKFTLGSTGEPDTFTLTESVALPPAVRLHVSVNVRFEVIFVALKEPLVGRLPLQAPEEVQVLALVELHDRATLLPDATVIGPLLPLARKSTVTDGGGGAAPMFTVTESEALPPGPVHVKL